MSERRLLVSALACAFAVACAPAPIPSEGHLVVHLDTDAPIPRQGKPESPRAGMAILDTVRIEVVTEDGAAACPSCRRELGLEETRLDEDATFTVVGSGATRRLLHAVAFRAEHAAAAGPRAVVEVWAALPPAPASGARDLTLALPLVALGRPLGTREAPIALAEGMPPRPRVLAAVARRRSCEGRGPEGSVCIPGGVSWMGGAELPVYANGVAARVVALAPFWLDAHEVGVSELRAGGLADGVVPSTGRLTGAAAEDFCTYTRDPGPYEGYPVNCVPFRTARAHCRARGGDLPTEAQLERASSALAGFTYVWGRDRPGCGDAVLGRGPRYELFPVGSPPWARTCLPDPAGDPTLERLGFPKPIARASFAGERDVLVLPGGEVRDLAGSLSEWTLDVWQDNRAPFWTDATLRVDPVSTSGDAALRVVRGSNWASNALPSWWRDSFPIDHDAYAFGLGFRCAYPALAREATP